MENLDIIQKAINVEVKNKYINIRGKREYFSDFMKSHIKKIMKLSFSVQLSDCILSYLILTLLIYFRLFFL